MAKSEKRGRAQAKATVEVERKFEVPDDFSLPRLDGLPGVATVSDGVDHALDATYYDSADLRLNANRVTLRRRTGGTDAGWHLKLSRPDGERTEVQHPLGRGTRLPGAVRDTVEVYLRGAQVVPAVRLQTHRHVRNLLDAKGSVLAEVALDEVTATLPQGRGRAARTSSWTELEVELVDGDKALLKAVGRRLTQAGAHPSDSPSKMVRALGERAVPPVESCSRMPDGSPLPDGSAAAVVLAYLSAQVRHLLAQDPLVRADEHDAVHQMRVACRRLRSALATFRPLFDRTVTDPIREELAWLGGELGAARDAEVVRDHLRSAAQAEPAELVLGPVVERIVATMDARYRAAHDEALVELRGTRYFALLDTLDALVTAPPLQVELASRPAPDVLLPLVRKTWTRTRNLVRDADAAATAEERDLLLHDVRKSAKRARYAGESLVAAFGKAAQRYAGRMSTIQEVLGEHQDSVVIRGMLEELAEAAHAAGEHTFTYGRLHALEQSRANRTEWAFQVAWAEASDTQLRTWMR